MPNTLSPNMSLILPTIGQEPGPNWAQDLNSSLSLVDQHNHASGSGVQITPAGLNINTDLTFNGNNAVNLKSTRFTAQISPLASGSDIGCVYVSGADLYYNDTLGNQVRLTIAGAVNGTPGSIGGLVAPATVTYVPANQAYVFQSNVNTSGSIDSGPVTIRNNTASSNGITIEPPTPLTGNYTITLPGSTPASTGIVEMASTGAVSVNTTLYPYFNPVGAMIMFAGNSAPTGWLLCDGSEVSQTTYANLYSVVGSAFNIGGEAPGNFRLPDMRRRVPMGAGGTGSATIGNSLGNFGGNESFTLSQTNLPSSITMGGAGGHYHTLYSGQSGVGSETVRVVDMTLKTGQNIPGSSPVYLGGSSTGPNPTYVNQLTNTIADHTHSLGGSDTPINNIQPSIILNYLIKF